jgi:hypothetical protein
MTGKSESARQGAPEDHLSRLNEVSTGVGQGTPRLILEIPLECRGKIHIVADSFEAELRLRRWLRYALVRREPLSEALIGFLDNLDARDERRAAA